MVCFDMSELPVEIERKYLLSELPPRVLRARHETLIQGYLPGEKLIERVRMVKSARTTTYFRTIKFGKGVTRIEIEEQTTKRVFDVLFSLTKKRRVSKTRYYVRDKSLTWEVDDFTDRKLVLAELEIPDAAMHIEFPTWLAPYVIRDVTDDSRYVNARLAK